MNKKSRKKNNIKQIKKGYFETKVCEETVITSNEDTNILISQQFEANPFYSFQGE